MLVALVTGCSSTSEIRQSAPIRTFSSVKSAKAIGVCIADRWEATPGGPKVTMRPTETGFMVAVYDFMNFNNTMFAVEVDDQAGGAVGKLYKGAVLGGGKFEAAIDSCK